MSTWHRSIDPPKQIKKACHASEVPYGGETLSGSRKAVPLPSATRRWRVRGKPDGLKLRFNLREDESRALDPRGSETCSSRPRGKGSPDCDISEGSEMAMARIRCVMLEGV